MAEDLLKINGLQYPQNQLETDDFEGSFYHSSKSTTSYLKTGEGKKNASKQKEYEFQSQNSPSITTLGSTSDFVINAAGEFKEHWSSTEMIPAKLIEVSPNVVLLECLVDYEQKIYELREFRRSLLEGKIEFSTNAIILIKYFERPGKFVIEFEPGNNLNYEQYFITDDTDVDSIQTGGLLR